SALTALQLTDLGRHRVIGGVCKAGVKISVLLQIKQPSHLLAGGVFKGRALIDGKLPGLSIFRLPASLDADCSHGSLICHNFILLNCKSSARRAGAHVRW